MEGKSVALALEQLNAEEVELSRAGEELVMAKRVLRLRRERYDALFQFLKKYAPEAMEGRIPK